MRVLCLGMDGTDHVLVSKLLARGRLPTLATVAAGGVFLPLRSTIPSITPTAWSSFLTGLNPAGHGILGFTSNPHRGPGRIESAATRRGPSLPRLLGEVGARSALVMVPFTYPPDASHGIVVTGFGGPSRPAIVPPSAARAIFAAHPTLVTAVRPTEWTRDVSAFARRLIAHAGDVADVCRLAMSLEPDLDLLCVDFMSTDIAGHLFWYRLDRDHPAHTSASAGDELVAVYEAVDRACGSVIDHAEWLYGEQPTVVLFSDHGMRPTYWTFHANAWLRDAGFARIERGSRRRGRRSGARLDVAGSRAYCFGMGGQIFVGERPEARNDPRLVDELAAALAGVRDPAGARAFDVKRKDELFRGPFLHRAPELVLLPTDDRVSVEPGDAARRDAFERGADLDLRGHGRWSGHHVPTGILAAAGPGIAEAAPAGAHITQLPATVLAMFGAEAELDAEPIEGLVAVQIGRRRRLGWDASPPSGAEPYSPLEAAAILERLEELGYE